MSTILNFTGTLLKNLVSKPVTKNYPEEPAVYPERSRGHIVIDVDQCISCGLCVRSCPPRCIKVDKNEGTWTINRFDCIAELAYSSHGLRPELSYGSHFFQDLVEAGTFYVALYPGEDGCVFEDALFSGCENVYSKLVQANADDAMADVIRVYDLGQDQAILYAEVGSQACFLAKV